MERQVGGRDEVGAQAGDAVVRGGHGGGEGGGAGEEAGGVVKQAHDHLPTVGVTAGVDGLHAQPVGDRAGETDVIDAQQPGLLPQGEAGVVEMTVDAVRVDEADTAGGGHVVEGAAREVTGHVPALQGTVEIQQDRGVGGQVIRGDDDEGPVPSPRAGWSHVRSCTGRGFSRRTV